MFSLETDFLAVSLRPPQDLSTGVLIWNCLLISDLGACLVECYDLASYTDLSSLFLIETALDLIDKAFSL